MIREALTFSVLATAAIFAVAEFKSNSHISRPAGTRAETATARVLYVRLRPSEEDIALWTAQGRAAAQRDLAAGRLVQLLWGLQMPHKAYDAALARRGIEQRNLGCAFTASQQHSAQAYVDVMSRMIERRFGSEVWRRIDAEATGPQ